MAINCYLIIATTIFIGGAVNSSIASTDLQLENIISSTNDWRTKRDSSCNIVITQHFARRVLSPGEAINLHCSASGDRPPRFLWERDGTVITSAVDQRYSIWESLSPGLGVVSGLNISASRVEDGGRYTCRAAHGDCRAAYSDYVHVYGPPYIRNLPPIKVQNGQQLTLRCPYYGYPISKIEWEHKGRKISTSTLQHGRYRRQNARWRRMTDIANEEGVLIVDRVVKEENGDNYVCVVYTATGEMARRSFEIQVVEAPELDELRVGSGLKEGQIVQITCNIVSGDPPIYFSWLKDGKKIAPNLKITERSSELFSVLIIKRVSLEHCGRYTCIAMNHVGSINQTADLFINVAPKWVEEPANISILVGQRGVIHCNANGYPTPNIHWMKRDESIGIWRPVLDLAGGGVMSLSNGTFIIEMVSLTDEGLYSCNVENGVGLPLNKNIWITINKPVHFDSLSTNLTAKLGYQAQLNCLPLGDHPIRIKWTLNGKPIDFSDSRLKLSETTLQSGSQSRIDIQYSESVDGGHYECKARNPHGMAVYSIFLRILEPPTPPSDVQIESVTSRTVKLSWRDTMRELSQYYTIQYSIWDHVKYINVTRKKLDIRSLYELRDLQPYSEYKVRIASGNQVDVSEFTPPIIVMTLQEAPSSSPISIQVQQTENPGELFVSWSPPPSDTHNGPIQGYHVKAEPRIHYDIDTADKVRIVKVLTRKGTLDTTLTGLLKNTRYSVTISAFNAAGSGPHSLPVYHNTREGAPELSPSSVECSGISSTSIRVSWQPRGQGDSLVGYTVLYNIEDEQWQNMSLTQTEVYLQGLSKFTNYSVKVAGYSNYGVGPYSYPIICATLQDVPGPPAVIKVVALSLTSLIVSWSIPERTNGNILYYNVYIKPAHSSNSPKSYRVPSQESTLDGHTLELKDLETKSYEVYVTASTSAGEGARSHIVIRELTNKVCTGSWSLGGSLWSPAKTRLSLQCRLSPLCINNPIVTWYKDQNPLTIQPPLYTLTRDYTLLLHDIDQSQTGNYSCVIKTSQGRDVVSYTLHVVHTPEAPQLRATPYKDSIHVEWDQPSMVNHGKSTRKVSYSLSWKESNGSWEEGFKGKGTLFYTIKGIKCGTQYVLRIVAENSVGTSTPAYLNVHTLGGVPISPSTVEWFWSNSTHIYVQLSGWDDNGCEIIKWDIEYRKYGELVWIRADNKVNLDTTWSQYVPSSFALATLQPAQWYQIKVTASNIAGSQTTVYNYATTTLTGESISPPTEFLDLNLVVISCSSVLVTVCFFACIFILIKRNSQNRHTEYRNSLTAECKSDSGNLTDCQSQTKECDRIYSAPIHMPDSKHELYEISPYAQFALGFRTFGHVDNQEPPIRVKAASSNRRYDSETSFQVRSESEESDYVSRSATLKSAPRKQRRLPHHR